VVNAGAGTGSYEPGSMSFVGVEPSETMIRQRLPSCAPVVRRGVPGARNPWPWNRGRARIVAGMKMKITEEIFQVGGAEFTSYEDAAVYLIDFGGQCALVDAGCGGSVTGLLENVRRCGADPGRVESLLLTHCHFDHAGGAEEVRRRSGCRIVAHRLDAAFLESGDSAVTAAAWYGAEMKPLRVDRKLAEPHEFVPLGGRRVEAVHTPGHSPGSVVYLAESDGMRVLFGQDVHGPLDPRLRSSREDYLRSLALLLSLEADVLCEGHFGVFRGKGEVARFIRSFMR